MSDVKKVVTQVDRTVKTLQTVAGQLNKQLAESQALIGGLADVVGNQLFEIQAKEGDLDALTQKYADEERLKRAELKLKIVENEDKVLADLLKSRGLESIVPAELVELKTELQATKDSVKSEVTKAVAIVESRASATLKVELERVKLQNLADVAQINAQLSSAKESNLSKDVLIAQLQAQIDADRIARVDIAKANSQQQGSTINVSK